MLESEANPQMVISTDDWKLSQEERQQLRRANARLVSEKNQLKDMLNRWQGIVGTVRGNVSKVEKEIQEYLKSVL